MLALLMLGCQGDCGADRLPGPSGHQVTLRIAHPAGGGTLALTLADEPAGTHALTRDGDALRIDLNGLPPLTQVDYDISFEQGRACHGGFTTDNLPPGLPDLTVSAADVAAMSDAPLLLGTLLGDPAAVFIIDRQGRWRWHQLVEDGAIVSDVHRVGDRIATNRYDQERTQDIGEVRFHTLWGEADGAVRTEWGHHVFAPLPDGELAWPALDIRSWTDPESSEELDVVGDRILRTEGSSVAEVFSIWDAETPVLSSGDDQGFYDLGYDWSHANALQHTGDGYLLSLGHLDTVYAVDASGDVVARHHPDDVTEGTPWIFQHDANLTDTGTLLLVSHEPDATVAREYAITEDGLSEVWSLSGPLSGFLGQARRLPGGNTVVNFGGKGLIREVTPAGQTVWQLEAGLGSWFGNVVLLEDVFGTVSVIE